MHQVSQEDMATLLQEMSAPPGVYSHKYTRGVACLCVGSYEYPGAALLACEAALGSPAGMVHWWGEERIRSLVLARTPEIVSDIADRAEDLPWDRFDALALGSGMNPKNPEASSRMLSVLAQAKIHDISCICDAGALDFLTPQNAEHFPSVLVLTPHKGEFIRLARKWGIVKQETEDVARLYEAALELSDLLHAWIVLKGSRDVLVIPSFAASSQPRLLAARRGPAWRATAGSGDVLAGALAGYLASFVAKSRMQRDCANAQPSLDPQVVSASILFALQVHACASERAVSREPYGERRQMNALQEEGHPIRASEIAHELARAYEEVRSNIEEPHFFDFYEPSDFSRSDYF